MTSSVIYKGNLRTELTHMQSGALICTDAPKDNHGLGEAFSPTDLVATALGSCMMSVMGIYARQHGLDMEGATVEIEKEMAANPRRISRIGAIIRMPAKGYSEKDKKALEHTAHTCPVAQSLSKDLVQDVQIIWE